MSLRDLTSSLPLRSLARRAGSAPETKSGNTGEELSSNNCRSLQGRYSWTREWASAFVKPARWLFSLGAPVRARDEIEVLLISALGHGLRTPLAAIQSSTEYLRDHPELPDDQRQHFLDLITAENQRLISMMDRLLASATLGNATGSLSIDAASVVAPQERPQDPDQDGDAPRGAARGSLAA